MNQIDAANIANIIICENTNSVCNIRKINNFFFFKRNRKVENKNI